MESSNMFRSEERHHQTCKLSGEQSHSRLELSRGETFLASVTVDGANVLAQDGCEKHVRPVINDGNNLLRLCASCAKDEPKRSEAGQLRPGHSGRRNHAGQRDTKTVPRYVTQRMSENYGKSSSSNLRTLVILCLIILLGQIQSAASGHSGYSQFSQDPESHNLSSRSPPQTAARLQAQTSNHLPPNWWQSVTHQEPPRLPDLARFQRSQEKDSKLTRQNNRPAPHSRKPLNNEPRPLRHGGQVPSRAGGHGQGPARPGGYDQGSPRPGGQGSNGGASLTSLVGGLDLNVLDLKLLSLGYVRPELVYRLCDQATSQLISEGETRLREEASGILQNLTLAVDTRCSEIVPEGARTCDDVVSLGIQRYNSLIGESLQEVDDQCANLQTMIAARTREAANATFQEISQSKLETAEETFLRRVAEETIKGERLFQQMVEEEREKAEIEFQRLVTEGRKEAEKNFTLTVEVERGKAEQLYQQRLKEGREKAENIFQMRVAEERAKGEKIFQQELLKGKNAAEEMFQNAVSKARKEGEQMCIDLLVMACMDVEFDTASADFCDEFCFFSGACDDGFETENTVGLRTAFSDFRSRIRRPPRGRSLNFTDATGDVDYADFPAPENVTETDRQEDDDTTKAGPTVEATTAEPDDCEEEDFEAATEDSEREAKGGDGRDSPRDPILGELEEDAAAKAKPDRDQRAITRNYWRQKFWQYRNGYREIEIDPQTSYYRRFS